MNSLHDNVLGSTVVKTVKNIRRKVQTSDDSKLSKPQSAATDDNDQAKTPLSSNSEEDETSANRNISSKRTISTTDKPKDNVFSRLAAKKSLSTGTRRKPEKRDMNLDFFDKQYKNAIKGGISSFYNWLKHKGLIEILMTRSKKVNEFVETSGTPKGYIIKRVVQNPHFTICFTALLNQMYKKEEVEGDLKNIAPSSFGKLENFFMEKIQYEVNLDNLDTEMKDHSVKLARLNKNRIEALKEKLASFNADPDL